MWAEAFSFDVKMPVHSSAISTPRSRCGSSAGLRIDLGVEPAVDRVEAQEVGVGLDRAEIVDRHHLDVRPSRLGDRPQHVAPDPTEPVDRYPHSHGFKTPLHGRSATMSV